MYWQHLSNMFKFDQDGIIVFWLLVLMIMYNIFLKIKKEHSKSEKLSKLVLILGLWGSLYLMGMSVFQVGNPSIPFESKLFELIWRIVASMEVFAFSLFGWFMVNTIDFFLAEKK